MAQAQSTRAINRREKNEDQQLTVWTEKTRLVLKIFNLCHDLRALLCVCRVRKRFVIHANRLQISDAQQKDSIEIIIKSGFNTQF